MEKAIKLKAGDRLVVTTPTGEVTLTTYGTMTGLHLRPTDAPAVHSTSMFRGEVRSLTNDGEVVVIKPN